MAKLCSMLVSATFVLAVGHGAGADGSLPLRRVRLYETGVGYFERTGAVTGKPTALPVPAGHLDDALKTLVVLSDDPKNGSVAGVEFGSSVSRSMARSMAGLTTDEAPLNLHALLKSLKGASVELKVGTQTIGGKLVELSDGPDLHAAGVRHAVRGDRVSGVRFGHSGRDAASGTFASA